MRPMLVNTAVHQLIALTEFVRFVAESALPMPWHRVPDLALNKDEHSCFKACETNQPSVASDGAQAFSEYYKIYAYPADGLKH